MKRKEYQSGSLPTVQALGKTSGLFVKMTGPSGDWMAPMPAKNSDKLTLGQTLEVTTPHAIEGVLKHPSDRWLTNPA